MALDRLHLAYFIGPFRYANRYVAAVKKMKADGVYQVFIDWHGDENVAGVAHDNATFLHWHRAYIRIFEIELQKADLALQQADDPGFPPGKVISLPWWGYPLLNSPIPSRAAGKIWRDNFMGPTGTGPDNIVPTGEFNAANWEIFHRVPSDLNSTPFVHNLSTPPALSRNLGKNDRRLPTTDEIRRTRERIPDFDKFPFTRKNGNVPVDTPPGSTSFRAVLEGFAFVPGAGPEAKQSQMHNGAHDWVGGLMGVVPTSPNDPVFWLHHSNIDRIWAIWQTRHPTSAAQYPTDADIIKARTDPPNNHNPRAILRTEAMIPWDAAGKRWETPAGALLFTTDVITSDDVMNWTKMGAGLGSYRIRGVSSRKLPF